MAEIDPILYTRLCRYLTPDFLDAMKDANGIGQSTQRLSSLHKSVSSFLPLYIVEDEGKLTQDFGRWNPGTFMFADVSGFTALNEKLMARAGAEGTEVLTQIINDYFSTMLEILAKSDGQLLKFAGDALLNFFPAQPGVDEFPKAVHTGLRMQRAMRERFQPIQAKELKEWFGDHNMELSMSIGLSRGNLFEALVGNLAQRDHMIMGKLPGLAMAAEEVGERDEVIIDAAMAEKYGEHFELRHLRDGFHQVVDNFGDDLGDYEFSAPPRRRKSSFLFSFSKEDLMEDLERELNRVETIARYVSSEIVNKMVVKGDHIESENRLGTTIFVHVTGFAELLEVWGEDKAEVVAAILSRYYGVMQRVIAAHGGVLTRSDPFKLGSKLLISFGAPVAHPDDADRAVMTALEMNRQLDILNNRLKEELPADLANLFPYINQRIGIAQGIVYAGEVGWRQRREYTVMGDTVNLAARLMARAEFGKAIVSQKVWERVNPYFETEAMEPFKAKGKNALVQAYEVKSINRESIARTSNTPFIGRDVIMLSMNLALGEAMSSGQEQLPLVGLHGEIGVGKTRLAKQLAMAAESSGLRVAWATCRSQSNRKATWAAIITQLLDLDQIADIQEKQTHLKQRLADMNLEHLIDVFNNLLFNTTSEQAEKAPARRERQQSGARNALFDKLSDPDSIGRKDEAARFRKQLIKQLKGANSPNESLWEQLQLATSLTDALRLFLTKYTEQSPVLIVIDDIHKEHPRALNMLKRLKDQLRGVKLLVLTTFETRLAPDLKMNTVAVPEFPEEETYLMTTAILNASELGNALNKFIWESTSGRALYIEALLYALESSGQLIEDQGIVDLIPNCNVELVPDSIRGLIISRLDQLSSEARQIVRAAAVFEDNFSIPMLQFAAELDEEIILSRMEDLIALQIFEAIDETYFRFQHGVTQQAVYEELTRLQRQKLHLKIADYYNRQEGIEENILLKVHHTLRAGQPMLAVDLLVKAARRAEEENNDIDQAIELYNRALDIFPNDTDLQRELERLQQNR